MSRKRKSKKCIQRRQPVSGASGTNGGCEENLLQQHTSPLRDGEGIKIEGSLLEQQRALFQRGPDDPNLPPEIRKAMLELQNQMNRIKEASKPFIMLTNAANESPEKFQKVVAEFYNALVFMQARTSDDVVKLVDVSGNILTALTSQQEQYEKQGKENDANNKKSNRIAMSALCIAVATLIVSIVVGIVSCCVAHNDSNMTSKEIVQAIHDCYEKAKEPNK